MIWVLGVICVRQEHVCKIYIQQHASSDSRLRLKLPDDIMKTTDIADEVSTAGLHLEAKAWAVKLAEQLGTPWIAKDILQISAQPFEPILSDLVGRTFLFFQRGGTQPVIL